MRRHKLVTEIIEITKKYQDFKSYGVISHMASLSDKALTKFHKEYMENMCFKFGIVR